MAWSNVETDPDSKLIPEHEFTTDTPIRTLILFGTRPEAVKLFPLIQSLKSDPRFDLCVAVTGQHREMLDQILRPFGVEPDTDLDIMRPGQSLNEIVNRLLPLLDTLYTEAKPHVVLVQGDTTSAFCGALAAYQRRIRVVHVEAGLRSFNRDHPYPEEANRRMIGVVADLHLAPTRRSAANLLREGVLPQDIVVTGNTAVDSLLMTIENPKLSDDGVGLLPKLDPKRRLVLITAHRRENWSPTTVADARSSTPLEEILAAISRTAERHPHCDFLYPVHRNPKVGEPARRILGGKENVYLTEPLPYIPFVRLMHRAAAILTDSGGIQEEAPSLGVPVLVTRETTERPEGLSAGTNRLVGTSSSNIEDGLDRLLSDPPPRPESLPCPNPFGDGKAAQRSHHAILHFLGLGERPEEFQGVVDRGNLHPSTPPLKGKRVSP